MHRGAELRLVGPVEMNLALYQSDSVPYSNVTRARSSTLTHDSHFVHAAVFGEIAIQEL